MNQDFANYVLNHVKEYLPSNFSDAIFETMSMTKSNGRNLTALSIRNNLDKGTPMIYLEDYEKMFNEGKGLRDVMNEIASTILQIDENDLQVKDSVVDSVFDYDKIKPKLALRLCDRYKSAEFLADKPYTPLGNLAITYRMQLLKERGSLGTAVIDNNFLEHWNITKEQLHKDALKAESERSEVRLYANTFERIPLDEMENLYKSEKPLKKKPQYILTNEQYTNGACVIALDGVLERVGELLQDDYYILPTSIHEVLIIPRSFTKKKLKYFDRVLKSGNKFLVTIDDKLSDHALLYNRRTNKLTYNKYKD